MAGNGSAHEPVDTTPGGPAAIVTGAAGAIGRATVVALAERGYRVAAVDLAGSDRSQLARAIDLAGIGRRVGQFDLDVTDADMADRVVADVLTWSGNELDLVVNNAGVRSAGLFTHMPLAAHRSMFEVNYFGVCNVTRAALPHLRNQRRGHIVVVSSVGALAGLPGLSGYCASKSAVEGWAESVAMELRPFGVRVTIVEPASIRSDIWRSGSFHIDETAPDRELAQKLQSQDVVAEARAGDPRSVATAIVRSTAVGERLTPTRVPVGITAIARHLARGVVPPAAQRPVLRRALSLPAPRPSPPPGAGSTVLITGASSGLGQGLMADLHDRGWRVIGTVRDRAKGDALRARLGDRSVGIVEMDQRDEASVGDAFRAVAGMCDGKLDAVIANAGLKVTGPFELLGVDALHRMIDVNVFGTFAVVRSSIDLLRANHGGRVVIIGSSSGLTGMPGWSGYAASKFALETWVESVAYELEPDGIRLTVVEPGTFRSEIYREGSSVPVTDGPYAHLAATVEEREQSSLEGAEGPERVIQQVARVLQSARPPTRVPVGSGARMRHVARGIVPGSVLQRLLMVR